MDAQEIDLSQDSYKIICKNYPSEFILDKNLAKEYFRHFGKLKRLTFRPKLRLCTVEYISRDGYLNALSNAGDYNGTIFTVTSEGLLEEKKKIKKSEPIWVDSDEVDAELAAMGGFAPKSYGLFEAGSFGDATRIDKSPKLKRSWANETLPKAKKKPKIKEKVAQKPISGEISRHLELISLIKSQAFTVEDKYKVLDARDKLIRIKLKKHSNLKSSATVGTCPDMCPEKERLMRETQHQVALYEQEDNGRSMNPKKAIKQYSRSSADQETPLSHELRPVNVLRMTMAYLMHSIIDMCETNDVNLAEWYHFMWDRTRGIRKDITQQELCSQGAVELIEQCARFHIHCSARLVAEDPSVFDQKINTENLTKCLQSLKYMYHDLQLKGVQCHNEAEFRAYIILLNLNDGNFLWEVQELPRVIQKSKEVRFALDVYSALDKNNYVKFFKLVYSTSYLSACVLMRYFVQVRITALKTLLKCYTSRTFRTLYPLGELKQLLAFDDEENAMDFVQSHGLAISEDQTSMVLDKNSFFLPEIPYVLDRSLNVVESKRTCSVGRIVCGKELPVKTFENHVPQDSFDLTGHLVVGDLLEDFVLEQTELDISEEIMDMADSSGVLDKTNTGTSVETEMASIFGETNQEQTRQPSPSIFSQPVESQRSIFGGDVPPNIFAAKTELREDQVDSVVKDTTSSNRWGASSTNIFMQPLKQRESMSVKPAQMIFGGATTSERNKSAPKGGFYFELPKMPQEMKLSESFSTLAPQTLLSQQMSQPVIQTTVPIEDSRELERKQQQEEEREKARKEREKARKEREEKERHELEKKRLEEETRRRIKKQKQEEELRKRMEELRKEEERLKDLEIRNDVRSVLSMIIGDVEQKMRKERLDEIKRNIRDRKMAAIIRKWRQVVLMNQRKRKAMDCSPVWVNTKTVEQSAEELFTASQELTLKLRKRYKYGRALEINILEDEKINKIDLFQLTYPTLNRRYFHLKGVMQKNIYWKVQISVPDHYELRNGLSKIEATLKDAFQWEERNGITTLIKQHKPNPMQSVTYCIERQRGLYVRNPDANGIIFIAKDFNSLLKRRILENLKELGVFTKIPIVVILQEYNQGDCELQDLIEENIVSDYIILIQNLTPSSLVNLVVEGLIYLAGKVEKPPPLELDTLRSFIEKYLCTEIWKRANSFTKWNSHYASSLRKPNIVIELYNEALARLKKIIFNRSSYEHPSFPEVFKDHLQSEIPDCLPCNYCYFPKFWKDEKYVAKLEKIFKNFALPKWPDEWPPNGELELEVSVSKYCTRVFAEPEKPFYKVMSVLLKGVDPNENFEDVGKVLWTDVVEILALEMLRQTNLSFGGTPFETKSVFNQYFVVYDIKALEDFNTTDWFYVNHPMIKKFVEKEMKYEKPDGNETKTKVVDIDLEKTIEEATKQLERRINGIQLRKECMQLNSMLKDLEDTFEVQKKISAAMEQGLMRALLDP